MDKLQSWTLSQWQQTKKQHISISRINLNLILNDLLFLEVAQIEYKYLKGKKSQTSEIKVSEGANKVIEILVKGVK